MGLGAVEEESGCAKATGRCGLDDWQSASTTEADGLSVLGRACVKLIANSEVEALVLAPLSEEEATSFLSA